MIERPIAQIQTPEKQPRPLTLSRIGRGMLRRAVGLAGLVVRQTTHGHIPTPDGHIYTVPAHMNRNDCASIMLGRYEKAEISLLGGMRPDHTIVEIGANIGVLARHAFETRLADGGKYVCVEPNPESLQALAANMSRAHTTYPSRNFEIINAALCPPESNGQTADFCVRPNLSSGLLQHLKSSKNEVTIPVLTRSLSSILKEHAPKGATLIMDAEGAEIDLLTRDAGAFGNIHQIAIELHNPELTGRAVTQADMIDQFGALGFAVRKHVMNSYLLTREFS
ncbi:MAG: FkbM family methyltransferase [Pseudomonadota bacterium]|nr:FkbM family methyltransferase [Pseudomonadota bacterium]